MTLGITNGTQKVGIASDSSAILKTFTSLYGVEVGAANPSGAVSAYSGLGITIDPTKSGIVSSMTDSTSVYKGKKYLYFYLGQFPVSALVNPDKE